MKLFLTYIFLVFSAYGIWETVLGAPPSHQISVIIFMIYSSAIDLGHLDVLWK